MRGEAGFAGAAGSRRSDFRREDDKSPGARRGRRWAELERRDELTGSDGIESRRHKPIGQPACQGTKARRAPALTRPHLALIKHLRQQISQQTNPCQDNQCPRMTLMHRCLLEAAIRRHGLKPRGLDRAAAAADLMNETGRDGVSLDVGGVKAGAFFLDGLLDGLAASCVHRLKWLGKFFIF